LSLVSADRAQRTDSVALVIGEIRPDRACLTPRLIRSGPLAGGAVEAPAVRTRRVGVTGAFLAQTHVHVLAANPPVPHRAGKVLAQLTGATAEAVAIGPVFPQVAGRAQGTGARAQIITLHPHLTVGASGARCAHPGVIVIAPNEIFVGIALGARHKTRCTDAGVVPRAAHAVIIIIAQAACGAGTTVQPTAANPILIVVAGIALHTFTTREVLTTIDALEIITHLCLARYAVTDIDTTTTVSIITRVAWT